MKRKIVSGLMLTLLFIGMLTLTSNLRLVKAIPEVVLSDKEIIPNPKNTSSIAFTATVESPTTTRIWFQIKASPNQTDLIFSQCIENIALENLTRITIEWTTPYDPRFDRLPTIEGTTIYMVDPYWFFNWPSNCVYAITTVYNVWENALTGYMSELKSSSMGPAIRILSPRWEEYTTTDVPLIFTVDEPTDWIGYSLDGQSNVTITGNTTLTDLFVGWHNIMVYANGTSGNMGFSDPRAGGWVHFAISELAIGIIIDSNADFTLKYVTTNSMYFNVSGPSGSIGWFNVTFPMINTTTIEIFIDGNKLTPPPFPIITTNGTHYFIYFELTLSTHTITTQFAPLASPHPVDVEMSPDALNMKSKGKWFTCYIQLLGTNLSDVDTSSILLNETVSIGADAPMEIGDYNNDAIPDLMVKFDRQAVIEYLKTKGIANAKITLTITGEVNGTSFEGTDTIKVIGQ